MGRAGSQKQKCIKKSELGQSLGKESDLWKRKRKERINQPPSTLNVDVHAILFALVTEVERRRGSYRGEIERLERERGALLLP